MTKTAQKHGAFEYRESLGDIIKSSFKLRLFRWLTADSSNIFLRGKDLISAAPQVLGVHEPAVTGLINYFKVSGYTDFLIDIGANIGLTTCQSGQGFKQIHMYEPNPYCCNLLEVNTAIALSHPSIHLHKYGLGAADHKATLTVPRHNWGGAFIHDEVNSYTEPVLAIKDELEGFVASNYFTIGIEIREATSTLRELFQNLVQQDLKRGVVKIDVEGYEPTVLQGLAASIPEGVKVAIVFESWDAAFDMKTVLAAFGPRASVYRFTNEKPWGKSTSMLVKLASLIRKREVRNRLIANDGDDWSGDIVIYLD